jgi:hypothetical protein
VRSTRRSARVAAGHNEKVRHRRTRPAQSTNPSRSTLGLHAGIANTSRVADQFDPAQVYRPPVAVDEAPSLSSQNAPLYVVSLGKLTLLFVATLGVYQIYWFYKHWQQHKAATGENIMPFWRAVFSVFFVHKLFAAISARSSGPEATSWSHAKLANVFVVLTIVGVVLSRISGASNEFGILDVVGIALGLLTVIPLRTAQHIANIASGDPHGTHNAGYGAGAIVALVLGGLGWLLIAAGTVLQAALPHS